MVFEGADIPLEEDILKKKVEFINTEAEFSGRNREQIHQTASRSSIGQVNVFSGARPTDTFFITGGSLSFTNTSAGIGIAKLNISSTIGGTNTLLQLNVGAGHTDSTSISFITPIKVDGAINVLAEQNTAGRVSGSLHGWIEAKKISGR